MVKQLVQRISFLMLAGRSAADSAGQTPKLMTEKDSPGQQPAGEQDLDLPVGAAGDGQQPAGEQPVGEQPAGEQPVGEQPAGEQEPGLPAGNGSYSEQATYDDIRAAYRLFLNRTPDPVGWGHFAGMVDTKVSLEDLALRFTNSEEFRAKMAEKSVITPVDLGGYSVCIRRIDGDFGKGVYDSRQYEPHVRAVIPGLLKEGQTVIDIGANAGAIAFLAATLVGPTGTVIAVEPNPANLQLLYAGIIHNQFENVRVLPYAASDRRAFFSLSGGYSNTFLIPPKSNEALLWYTQSVVLDEELATLPSVDFIKVDIEGHEPLALAGCARLIEKHRPTLLTEFNPRCLTDIQRFEPIEFLRQVLQYYTKLHVISIFGDSVEFETAEDVMDYWRERDAQISAEKLLPAGLLHFDIIATA